jgi:hypothetical protein
MSEAAWWYASNGQRMGPVALADLGQLIETGTIQLDTLVWTEGMAAWQPASSVAALESYLDMPPPLPPPIPNSSAGKPGPKTTSHTQQPRYTSPQQKPASSGHSIFDAGAMKGIGIVLVLVGGYLLVHSFLAVDTFSFRFNNFIGNNHANQGIGIDMIVGFVMAIAGAAMITKSRKKH